MYTTKKVAKNTIFLLGGRLATKLISFFILLYIARELGPTDFGKFSFVFAFIYFFGFITEAGIHDILVREAAKDPDNAGNLIGNATILKIFLSLIALLLALITIYLMDYPESTRNSLYAASIGLLIASLNSFGVIYEVKLKMEYWVVFSVVSRIFFFLVVLLASIYNLNLLFFVFASIGADLLYNVLAILHSRKFVKVKFDMDYTVIKKILHEALPVAIASVFTMIYFRVDVVMLSFMKGDIDVGIYSAAYRLTEAFTFLPSVLITSIFPLMSKYKKTNSQTLFNYIYIRSFKYLLASGLLIGVIITFLAEKIILLIYGVNYYESIKVLQILIWATSIMFVNILISSTYISSGQQQIIAKVSAFAALFNIILNLLLIPTFTYVGAAFATAMTEFIVMIFGIYWTNKNVVNKYLFKEGLYPLLGAFLITMVIYLLSPKINIILLCISSSFVFCLILHLTGWFDLEDKRLLKSIFIRNKT